MKLASVENGQLKGTLTGGVGVCGGSSPIEGTYQANNLKFSAPGRGRVAGCDVPQLFMLQPEKAAGEMRRVTRPG